MLSQPLFYFNILRFSAFTNPSMVWEPKWLGRLEHQVIFVSSLDTKGLLCCQAFLLMSFITLKFLHLFLTQFRECNDWGCTNAKYKFLRSVPPQSHHNHVHRIEQRQWRVSKMVLESQCTLQTYSNTKSLCNHKCKAERRWLPLTCRSTKPNAVS